MRSVHGYNCFIEVFPYTFKQKNPHQVLQYDFLQAFAAGIPVVEYIVKIEITFFKPAAAPELEPLDRVSHVPSRS